MKIHQLFSDKSKWTKDFLAKDKNDWPASPVSPDAVCFCLRGAVLHCYGNSEKSAEVINKIQNKIKCGIPTWNDDEKRTFKDVKKLVTELDV